MNLASLLDQLPPKSIDGVTFPRNLLGTFRRKSISFCTGKTDEKTIVYWVQSKNFSIDLRLADAAGTPMTQRQGWIGDTFWDSATQELSWDISRSYQPTNQWPEPAQLSFIGNCVLEYAPSGAYVEDWRQNSSQGPLLGLRLISMTDPATGAEYAMDGGLILAGEHAAFAKSRLPEVDDALGKTSSLDAALAEELVTPADIESYEVSIAINGLDIAHSTQSDRYGKTIAEGQFSILPDGHVTQLRDFGGTPYALLYEVDVFEPEFSFENQTPCTQDAQDWMELETLHLSRNAAPIG